MNKTNRIRVLSVALLIFCAGNLSPTRADASTRQSFAPGQIFAIGLTTWGKYLDSTSDLADCELNIPHKIQVLKQTSEKNGRQWVAFKVIPTVPLRARECTAEKPVRMLLSTAERMRRNSTERAIFRSDVAKTLAGKGTIQSRDHVRAGDFIAARHELFAKVALPIAHGLKTFREADACRIAANEKIQVLGFLVHPGPFGKQTLLKYHGPEKVEDAGRCPAGAIYAEYLDFSSGDYSR